MNMRQQLFISGGGQVQRTITSRKGRVSTIIDPNARCRTAIVNMYAAGVSVRDIAHRLDKSRLFVLRQLVKSNISR